MLRIALFFFAMALVIGGVWLTFRDRPSVPTDAVVETEASYDLAAARAKFARVEMAPDLGFLNDEERGIVNLLIEASKLMDEIYLRQVHEDNPALRAEIAASERPDRDALLDMFDLHFGVWDTLDEYRPFYGDIPYPEGAGFYPADMTRAEFEDWIAAHPEDEAAFRSPFTVIRRDGDGLRAIPYSDYYREWLEPAAALLRQAAALSSNKSLATYLSLRADAFESNDYFASDMAWMDLEGTPIEIVIGPYEVYTDRLFGTKTAFESFLTVKRPEDSAALARFKGHLRDMEANLPVEEHYKNFKRGFASPILVADQVRGGGDNVPGVQTIAFNLPNDERVREAKGAKKVILENVLGAKFDRILAPMAGHVLVPEQAAMLSRKYMGLITLFHELSHSLGPGTIEKDGRETTVNAELRDLYSAIEEGKADIMGVYNILFMMDQGELPSAERDDMLATWFAGLFRSMRFGIDEAHGRGAAFQYGYMKDAGVFTRDEAGLHRVDFERAVTAIRDLVRDVVVIEGDGDYEAARQFLERYARRDPAIAEVNAALGDIPVDIDPIYPDRI
ncbi:MAG: hypothetical protein Kow00104_12130 [Rhodothalassiaceae bacterium]